MTEGAATPPGVDPAGATAWFEQHVPGAAGPFTFDRISGGKSNLTILVHDAGGPRWVLRRPPLGAVLATAHDMSREWKVLSALAGHVPVPPPIGFCADESVIGAPFHVTGFVAGMVLRDATAAEGLAPELRTAISRSFVETLAKLHLVEPAAVGLDDLAKHDGYLERQLKRWRTQYDTAHAVDVDDIVDVHERLVAAAPAQQRLSVVHADYRLDNVLLDDAGQVQGVLDWELCTLGDPLADLATLLMYWTSPGEPSGMSFEWPTSAGGFLERKELVDIYAATTELDLSMVDLYVAFARWRAACIGAGAHARLLAGASGLEGDELAADIDNMESGTRYQARLAREALDGLGV